MTDRLKLRLAAFIVTTLTKIFIVVCRDQISVLNTEIESQKIMNLLELELK